MTRKEIENLNNTLVTQDILEEIELHEDVETVETVGGSSQYQGATWYDVQFTDGGSIDVFVK